MTVYAFRFDNRIEPRGECLRAVPGRVCFSGRIARIDKDISAGSACVSDPNGGPVTSHTHLHAVLR